MNLYLAIEQYLTLKRSLGAVFAAEARILWMLGRAVGNISLEELSPEACYIFCRGKGPPTRWWERKHYALQGFFAFVVARGHLDASPLMEKAPRTPRDFEPYIYSREELERLLEATTILESERSPLQPTTFRVLLLVLYAAGLRPGEGLRLRCCDVDLGRHVLAIWDTKFFKSRFVPIGQHLGQVLESYRTKRLALPMPAGQESAFFPAATGDAIRLKWLERVFARLRGEAGVSRPGWHPLATSTSRPATRLCSPPTHRVVPGRCGRPGPSATARDLPWPHKHLRHPGLLKHDLRITRRGITAF